MSLKVKSTLLALMFVPTLGMAADTDHEQAINFIYSSNAMELSESASMNKVEKGMKKEVSTSDKKQMQKTNGIDYSRNWSGYPKIEGHEVY